MSTSAINQLRTAQGVSSLSTSTSTSTSTSVGGGEVMLGEVVARDETPIVKVRTFKHLFAGANTIMPDGRKLVFGGHVGGPGTIVVSDPEEIKYLADLCKTASSQISEVKADSDGRITESQDNTLAQETAVAAADAAANAARDANPNVAAARANIANSQKQNG